MAVFTPVTDEQVRAFLSEHALGDPVALTPIAEGVDNTNYRLDTTTGRFVLTLFERPAEDGGLNFCLGLTDHLAARGFPAARPQRRHDGGWIGELNGRPAAIVEWLTGAWLRAPGLADVETAGALLARLHLATADFPLKRDDPMGPENLRRLAARCDARATGEDRAMLDALVAELDRRDREWPQGLPQGAVHADYFPDNVLFDGDRPGGVIDFYFGHVNSLAYDLATALNAWTFDGDGRFDADASAAFLKGYGCERALSAAEVEALPLLCAASAVRFTMTRLHDRLHHDPSWLVTPKDPAPFFRRIAFHRAATPETYGVTPA